MGSKAEEAFSETTRLLFGRGLRGLARYDAWLMRRIPRGERANCSMSGRELWFPGHALFEKMPRGMVVSGNLLGEVSGRRIALGEGTGLAEVCRELKKISSYIIEFSEGTNTDVAESTVYLNLAHAYRCIDCFNSKNMGECFFIDDSEHLFGSYCAAFARFSIHVYNSNRVAMCFECDSCRDCSGLMFCHNCENVRDSLLCSNAKNMQYALLNRKVGKEKYESFRRMLTEYILRELEEKAFLEEDIFNIGCGGKG